MSLDFDSKVISATNVQDALEELMWTHNFIEVLYKLGLSSFSPMYIEEQEFQRDVARSRMLQAINDYLDV